MMKKLLLIISFALLIALQSTEIFAQGTTLFDSLCPDRNLPHCQQAKKMLENMALVAMGKEITGDAWVSSANRMLDNKIVTEAKFKQGITYDDGLNYWTFYLASDYYSPATRREVINRVLDKIYGRSVMTDELPQIEKRFKNQTLWYDRMFEEELKKLNEDGQLRKETINRAYYAAFGRKASIYETNKWQYRKEYHSQMVEELRKELYSKEGGVELLAVVTRYIESLPKAQKASVNYNETLNKFKQNKWIYTDVAK